MDTMTLAVTADRPRREVVAPTSRSIGAAVAFSIALLAGLVGLVFELPLLLLGVPAATIAGWLLGPKISAAGGVGGMSVAMAAETTAIADALVIFGAAFASLTGSSVGGVDPLTTIAGAAFLWALGFVVVGIPMMLVTVPCGFLWAVLVSKVARTNAHAAVEP